MIAGVGGGKTLAGVELALKAAQQQPGVPGALVNATYTLLRDTTLDEWFTVVPPEIYRWRAAEHRIAIANGTTIYCRSADQPLKRIAGLNLGWVVYDEAGLARDGKAAKMLLQRIRVGNPAFRFFAIVTSPRGYEWLREWCSEPDVHLIRATSYDNPATGTHYIAEMEKDFPPGTKEHAQEMLGEFIHRTGLLYGDAFTPPRHIEPRTYDYSRPYDLGWDPGKRASAVVAIQELRPGRQTVVREWLPENTPTEDVTIMVERDMGKPPRKLYCDTPSKLNTRTGITDVEAFYSAWPRVDIIVSGGRVRESDYRQTAVRTALNGERLLFSSALVRDRAGAEDRGLIRALQTMPWRDESSRDERVDEKDPRKHVLDALEFAVVHLLPPRFYDPAERRARMGRAA